MSRILREGERFESPTLTLVLCQEAGDRTIPPVFVIPKRRVSASVERNRLRRRLKEILRLDGVPLEGASLVFLYRGDGDLAWGRLRYEMQALIGQAVKSPLPR
ncbi:MAG: ribonuclease P protein component [Candidatus Omnitrophica bacterium]|nr:ribonuclease P protein component [Candidatus Omnitrophota bacterium]